MNGITDKEHKIITEILEKYNKYEYYYYGSRVNGNYSAVSDLDILIKGQYPIPASELEDIKEKFDESNLPYITNFVDYHKISKEFYENIKTKYVNINSLYTK